MILLTKNKTNAYFDPGQLAAMTELPMIASSVPNHANLSMVQQPVQSRR
jgi:hypothetical protein